MPRARSLWHTARQVVRLLQRAAQLGGAHERRCAHEPVLFWPVALQALDERGNGAAHIGKPGCLGRTALLLKQLKTLDLLQQPPREVVLGGHVGQVRTDGRELCLAVIANMAPWHAPT